MRNNQERLNPTQFQQPQQPEQPQPQGVFSFAVPTEFVELPSKGKYYPEGHPLHMVKEVEIKHMTAKDEDILSSQSLIERGIALERLLQNILIDKRIDVNSLLKGDKNALLIACRKYGYGVDYEASIICNDCYKSSSFFFDISEWKAKEKQENQQFQYVEKDLLFHTQLPNSKINVSFKLLNSIEQKRLEQKILDNDGENGSNFLLSILNSVEEYTDIQSFRNFVEHIPVKDAVYLRSLYKHVEPNIETTSHFKCSNCGHEEDVEVPLGVGFFWPDI